MQALFVLPYKQHSSTVQRPNILSPAAASGQELQQHQNTNPYREMLETLSLVFPFPASAHQEPTDWRFNISSFPGKDILSEPWKQMTVKVRDKEINEIQMWKQAKSSQVIGTE